MAVTRRHSVIRPEFFESRASASVEAWSSCYQEPRGIDPSTFDDALARVRP